MAKGKRARPTANRNSSSSQQQRTRDKDGRGGNNAGGIQKAKKMKNFSRISSSSFPRSGHGQSSKSNDNQNGAGLNTHLAASSSSIHTQTQSQKSNKQVQHIRPIIPFGRRDRILLVGEGDFSFARSLAVHHHCKSVLATCYDSRDELYAKYPQAKKNVDDFLPNYMPKEEKEKKDIKDGEKQEEDPTNTTTTTNAAAAPPATTPTTRAVLFSIDARKLANTKDIRRGFPSRKKIPAWEQARARVQTQTQTTSPLVDSGGPWDTICFNFPHVGGLSTDVNRQVRANQELLVAFFKASKPLLSLPDGGEEDSDIDEDEDDVDLDSTNDIDEASPKEAEQGATVNVEKKRLTRGGQILVTLFEGEPYTLWNIKDLARHAGLSVVTSFKFPWSAYPGYSHARTIGAIEGRNGAPGGWRGEDRLARTYVFQGHEANALTSKTGKKRSKDDSDSDD